MMIMMMKMMIIITIMIRMMIFSDASLHFVRISAIIDHGVVPQRLPERKRDAIRIGSWLRIPGFRGCNLVTAMVTLMRGCAIIRKQALQRMTRVTVASLGPC